MNFSANYVTCKPNLYLCWSVPLSADHCNVIHNLFFTKYLAWLWCLSFMYWRDFIKYIFWRKLLSEPDPNSTQLKTTLKGSCYGWLIFLIDVKDNFSEFRNMIFVQTPRCFVQHSTGPTCQFLYSVFPVFFWGFWLGDLLASGCGSGTTLVQLGVLSLAEQSHTQIS